jgi:hypothetical protein
VFSNGQARSNSARSGFHAFRCRGHVAGGGVAPAKQSRKFKVPNDLASLYNFANTLDVRISLAAA